MKLLLTISLFACLPFTAQSQQYEDCVLDHLNKAQTTEAIDLLKLTCKAKSKVETCVNKPVKDMTDNELFVSCEDLPSNDDVKIDSLIKDLKHVVDDNSKSKEVRDFSHKILKVHFKIQKSGKYWVEELD